MSRLEHEENQYEDKTKIHIQLQQNFYMILSEIERAVGHKFPHSQRTGELDEELLGDKDTLVYTWMGADTVKRNIHGSVYDDEEVLPTFKIFCHAWSDDEVNKIRHWQFEEIANASIDEFLQDNNWFLASLERAYVTTAGWTYDDLVRKGKLL